MTHGRRFTDISAPTRLITRDVGPGQRPQAFQHQDDSTWDPHTKEDKVQRRGTRFLCNNYSDRTHECVTAMLNSLSWIPLSTRRYDQRLILLYKIQHNQVDIGNCNILRPNDRRTTGAYRRYQPHAVQSIYKYSFFPRMIHDWNSLPTAVPLLITEGLQSCSACGSSSLHGSVLNGTMTCT